jgi:hypothetical protein
MLDLPCPRRSDDDRRPKGAGMADSAFPANEALYAWKLEPDDDAEDFGD